MIETLGWHKDQWLDIDKIFFAANNRGLKFAAVSYTHLTLPTTPYV